MKSLTVGILVLAILGVVKVTAADSAHASDSAHAADRAHAYAHAADSAHRHKRCLDITHKCGRTSECCSGCCNRGVCDTLDRCDTSHQGACANFTCPPGEECYLQQVQCFAAPCPPIAACRPKAHKDSDCE